MGDKAAGKGTGSYAEAGDEAFQNARLDSIELFLADQMGYEAPVQEVTEETPVEEVPITEGGEAEPMP